MMYNNPLFKSIYDKRIRFPEYQRLRDTLATSSAGTLVIPDEMLAKLTAEQRRGAEKRLPIWQLMYTSENHRRAIGDDAELIAQNRELNTDVMIQTLAAMVVSQSGQTVSQEMRYVISEGFCHLLLYLGIDWFHVTREEFEAGCDEYERLEKRLIDYIDAHVVWVNDEAHYIG
jgi:hypothetical protein